MSMAQHGHVDHGLRPILVADDTYGTRFTAIIAPETENGDFFVRTMASEPDELHGKQCAR